MITIRSLKAEVADNMQKECPRIFDFRTHDSEYILAVLDKNVIIKTHGDTESCVTIDLGGHLLEIDRKDFIDIVIA